MSLIRMLKPESTYRVGLKIKIRPGFRSNGGTAMPPTPPSHLPQIGNGLCGHQSTHNGLPTSHLHAGGLKAHDYIQWIEPTHNGLTVCHSRAGRFKAP